MQAQTFTPAEGPTSTHTKINTISCLEPLWALAKVQVLSHKVVGMHQLRISAYVFGLNTTQIGLYIQVSKKWPLIS